MKIKYTVVEGGKLYKGTTKLSFMEFYWRLWKLILKYRGHAVVLSYLRLRIRPASFWHYFKGIHSVSFGRRRWDTVNGVHFIPQESM